MAPNSQEAPKPEQQEAPLIPSPISGQQQQDSPVDQSQEEQKVEELAPIKTAKTTPKKKKVKEPQVVIDSPTHITIK